MLDEVRDGHLPGIDECGRAVMMRRTDIACGIIFSSDAMSERKF
jgi:hypothetical protein